MLAFDSIGYSAPNKIDDLLRELILSFFFQAIDAKDALAKSVYASLFEWLVEQINKSLAVGKRRTGRSISILDIYGFESFEVCTNNAFVVIFLVFWIVIFMLLDLFSTEKQF